jgi:cytochrome b561
MQRERSVSCAEHHVAHYVALAVGESPLGRVVIVVVVVVVASASQLCERREEEERRERQCEKRSDYFVIGFNSIGFISPPYSSSSSSSSPSSPNLQKAWNDTYSKAAASLHWIGAVGMTFLIGSALVAGQIPNDPKQTTKEKLELRQWIMHNHESVGLLMLAAMVPRVAYRLLNRAKLPRDLPEPAWQVYGAKAMHGALYGALVFMPISGLAFGYLSGWGVPFFKWNVPGASKEAAASDFNKKWEKFFYENHHRVGNILTWYLFPLHIGAIGFTYFFRGHNIINRMLPWASKAIAK